MSAVLGEIVVCRRHRNPDGLCISKKAVPVRSPVFSKHLKGGRF